MSNTQLRAILPQIHRLFSLGVITGLSDRVLVHRFCTGRDESAFTVLVARHGPMVLSVCRSVLRHESDAEDAFQAVFLILVRRARSIRIDDSLGGWLHGVAFRVARRANAQSARRRARELTGVGVDTAPDRAHPTVDPNIAGLHEEIAHLPHSHREALVLCLLEGKTQVEAAQEIGCGEATVRRRLARARERLRARLERRQLGPIAPVPLPIVPPALIEAAARGAGGPLTALASSVLAEIARTKALVAAVALLAVGLVTAVAVAGLRGVAPQTFDRSEPEAPAAGVVTVQALPANATAAPANAGQQPLGVVTVPGRVVGPDGKPVAGAAVFLRDPSVNPPVRKATTDANGRFRFTTDHELGWKMTQIAAGETAPGEITATAFPDTDEIKNLKPRVIAVAEGFGFGLPTAEDALTLQLSTDLPIFGRVTDKAGQPVAGARIRVRNMYWPRSEQTPSSAVQTLTKTSPPASTAGWRPNLDRWLEMTLHVPYVQQYLNSSEKLLTPLVESLGDIPAAHAPLIAPVTTDAAGRFRLAGIGKERVAELIIDGPGIASSLIVAATRPIEKPIPIPAKPAGQLISNDWEHLFVYGNRVDHVAGPGRAVEGVIRDRGSGQPLAGLRVVGPWRSPLEYAAYGRFRSTSDDQGRYRIEGLPVPSHADFKVEPPADHPYFGVRAGARIENGPAALQADLSLRRGIEITGRVLDDATGQPVQAIVSYYAFSDNALLKNDITAGAPPEMQPVNTDQSGNFRLVAYPGRGFITAWNSNYLRGVGVDKIEGLVNDDPLGFTGPPFRYYPPHQFSPENVNAVVLVDAAKGAQSVACELRLKKGKSREVMVVGPDGVPQSGTQASGLMNQIQNPMSNIAENHFTVANLYPGESREVVAMLMSRKWAGVTTVTRAGDGPVTLQLRPWATVTGRLVDNQGKPPDAAIEIMLDNGKLPLHTIGGRGYDRPVFPVDRDGRFRIEGLIAGPTYSLKAFKGGVQIVGTVARNLVLKPGETRDLGDVKPSR